MIVFSACGKKEIDLSDYVKIDASGYDGIGTASAEIDYRKFSEDHKKAII